MVLPMEIGHAGYARPIIEHLVRNFRSTTLLTFARPLFPNLSQDTVLLLAEGKGEGFAALTWNDLPGPDALKDFEPGRSGHTRLDEVALAAGQERLNSYFIDPLARDLYRELVQSESVTTLGDCAHVGIGYVTGANSFFHLDKTEAKRLRLPQSALRRSVFRASALRGIRFKDEDWADAAGHGDAGFLLMVHSKTQRKQSLRLDRYLDEGERNGVPNAYKCRVRKPWYRVPNVYHPDGFLTYMSGWRPRFVANETDAVAPNSLHIARLGADAPLGQDAMAVAWFSALTGLSTELEGHAMGGGMLKLEPREAARVLLPRAAEVAEDLAPEIDQLVRRGDAPDARRRVDEVVLQGALNLTAREVSLLNEAAGTIRERRYSRGRK